MRDYARLDKFLDARRGDVYPETPSEPHLSITRLTIENLLQAGIIRAGMRVLDVGCGQGLALAAFREAGLHAVGTTLGEDYAVCRARGFEVYEMDQNFMTFADGLFDFLWCRHVLEHSIAPAFTLSEYRRILRAGGHAYVEVPAPDTSAHHETNVNHYSVLPHSAWIALFARAGLAVDISRPIDLTVPCGPDLYWSFLLRRDG
jgi:SAM-dependent methyltransferase